MNPYSDDSKLAVGIQSRAVEAFVLAHKWYRKSWVLNFVTFTVGLNHPGLHQPFTREQSVHIAQSGKFAGRSHPFAHYSRSRRIVFTAILTLFSHYSHGRTLFARSPTTCIRTPLARSHNIRTVAHYSHTIRMVAHYSRGSHTFRAIITPNSQTIRTSSHPGHTIRAVGASPFALIHAVFAQFTRPFAFVNVR